MRPNVDAAILAAISSDHVRPFYAITLDYPLGMVRATSLPQNVVIGGQTYLGAGLIGELSDITEGGENRSYGFTVSICGIPNTFLQYLRSQDPHGRLASVSLGLVDAGYKLLAAPKLVKTGYMDTQTVLVDQTTAVLVSVEDANVDWERARVRRWTHEDQQAAYPGDLYFDSMAAMANLNLRWGR